MTREQLLCNICPQRSINICKQISCHDCDAILNNYLDEYDKHIIAECEAEHDNLADMIRDIHDCVSMEMYRKGVDDFVEILKTYFVIPHDVMVIEMFAERLKEQE